VDAVSSEEGTQCTFKDLIKELVRNGHHVVHTVKSPQGELYLLLGFKNP
jgi:hypothetical protein